MASAFMCPTVCKTYRKPYRLFRSKEAIQRRFFFNFEICYRYKLVIGPRALRVRTILKLIARLLPLLNPF